MDWLTILAVGAAVVAAVGTVIFGFWSNLLARRAVKANEKAVAATERGAAAGELAAEAAAKSLELSRKQAELSEATLVAARQSVSQMRADMIAARVENVGSLLTRLRVSANRLMKERERTKRGGYVSAPDLPAALPTEQYLRPFEDEVRHDQQTLRTAVAGLEERLPSTLTIAEKDISPGGLNEILALLPKATGEVTQALRTL